MGLYILLLFLCLEAADKGSKKQDKITAVADGDVERRSLCSALFYDDENDDDDDDNDDDEDDDDDE